MSRVPLSDEETRVIFAGESRTNFAQLDPPEQAAVIQRLLDIVDSDAPPSTFVREQIDNLDIISFGSQGRLYTKVVDNVPRENSQYHIIYLFFVDEEHDYPQQKLVEYSSSAAGKVSIVTDLSTVSDIERYLDDYNALDAESLRDLLP